MLKFYDYKRQLISVTVGGEIGLWDSQKLTKFQVHKTPQHMLLRRINTSTFYKPLGKLMVATTKIFTFELEEYKNIKIQSQDQQAILNSEVAVLFNKIQQTGIYGQEMQKDAEAWEKMYDANN